MRTKYSVGESAIATRRVRRRFRSAPQLIPVVVTAEPPAVVPQPSTAAAAIEIDLAGKYRVRVGVGVEAEALRRVLDVLERR